MNNSEIEIIVKKLEKYFIGYKANGNTLKSEAGFEFRFHSSWNNKTTVSGIGGTRYHSIGCSFTKPVEKIAKDIKRRLFPDYRDDFLKTVKSDNEKREFEEKQLLMLEALKESAHAEIKDSYWNSRAMHNKYISANGFEIKQTYSGDYEFTVDCNFSESLKLIGFLNTLKSPK